MTRQRHPLPRPFDPAWSVVHRPTTSHTAPWADQTYDTIDELAALLPERHLRLVFDHWNSIRGTVAAPARRQMDESAIVEALPHVFINERLADGTDYRVRLIGSAFTDVFRADVTGRLLSEVFAPALWAEVMAEHERIAETKMPTYVEVLMREPLGIRMLYQRVLMPLSDDGSAVNKVLGAAVFSPTDALDEMLSMRSLDDPPAEMVIRRVLPALGARRGGQ